MTSNPAELQTTPVKRSHARSYRLRDMLLIFFCGFILGGGALYAHLMHQGREHPDPSDEDSLGLFLWTRGVSSNVDLDYALGYKTMLDIGPEMMGETEKELMRQVGYVRPLEKIRWNFPFCYPHNDPNSPLEPTSTTPPTSNWPPVPTDGNRWVQLRNSELMVAIRDGRVVDVRRCSSD